jgi:tetratricopeptide (TPR) repeat protein
VSDLAANPLSVTDDDRRKAKAFFDRAASVGSAGQFEYAIELYLQGIRIDPESIDAHQALREIALRRKASGGKPKGMFEAMKLAKGKDERQNLTNAESLLAFDPGERKHMLAVAEAALKLGAHESAAWASNILLRANDDHPKPELSYYTRLLEFFKIIEKWDQAIVCASRAAQLKPDDMDLAKELKDLSARQTISRGNYQSGGTFRDSVRDADKQRQLIEQEKDVGNEDYLVRAAREAEQTHLAEPNEPGKVMKYVEALRRLSTPEAEQKALDVLESSYERTKSFRFKQAAYDIRIRQLHQLERVERARLAKDPKNPELLQAFAEFEQGRATEELAIFRDVAEQYPTELRYRYEIANRLMALKEYSDAIPLYQQASQDPKLRTQATLRLGQAFLFAEFVDEAVDTLRALADGYEIKGDDNAKEIYYWFARSLEAKNDIQTAIKNYSQVAQWDFTYRDVQVRIKRLRNPTPTA